MTLEEIGLEFCRRINASPDTKSILKIVQRLQSSARGLGNKIYPTPILGLLLYHQDRLKNLLGKSAFEEISDWNENEKTTLFAVHEQIRELNNRCLAPLLTIVPTAIDAVNPYKRSLETPYIPKTLKFFSSGKMLKK